MKKILLIAFLLPLLTACADKSGEKASHAPQLDKPFHPIMP